MNVLLPTILIFMSLSYTDTKSVQSNRDRVPGRNPSNRDKVLGRNPTDMGITALNSILEAIIENINEGTKLIQTPNLTVTYFDTKSTPSNRDKVLELDPTSVSSVISILQDLLTIVTRQINARDMPTETQSTNIDAGRTLPNLLDIDENEAVVNIEKRIAVILSVIDYTLFVPV